MEVCQVIIAQPATGDQPSQLLTHIIYWCTW